MIPELTIEVVTRAPQTAVGLHHHGVVSAYIHVRHAAIDDLHITGFVDVCPIPKRTIGVVTCAPQTAVVLEHHSVVKARRYVHRTTDNV